MPSGTPSGKGLYLTVYPLSRPNTDTICSTLYTLHSTPLTMHSIKFLTHYTLKTIQITLLILHFTMLLQFSCSSSHFSTVGQTYSVSLLKAINLIKYSQQRNSVWLLAGKAVIIDGSGV